MGERRFLGGIEALRAYAAVAIILYHVVWIAGFDPPQALMVIKRHAAIGVPLFFAVSAFSLAYGYEDRLKGEGAVRDFYLRRLFRIAPLYYASCLARIAVVLGPAWAISHPLDLALAATFTFNLSPAHVEGIALASWSIGVEMLFYLVFPAVIALARDLVSALRLILAAGVVAWLFALKTGEISGFVQHSILFNLPYFGAGLVAYRLFQLRRDLPFWPLAGFTLGSALFLMWLVNPWAVALTRAGDAAVYQLWWTIPIAAACLAMASNPSALVSNPVTRWLGKVSFSLYLAHPYVIPVLNRSGVYAAIRDLPGGAGVTFIAASLATIAATALVSWPLYAFIEQPGQDFGRRFIQRLRARQTADAQPRTA